MLWKCRKINVWNYARDNKLHIIYCKNIESSVLKALCDLLRRYAEIYKLLTGCLHKKVKFYPGDSAGVVFISGQWHQLAAEFQNECRRFLLLTAPCDRKSSWWFCHSLRQQSGAKCKCAWYHTGGGQASPFGQQRVSSKNHNNYDMQSALHQE